jgi:hypothetical protein
VTIVPVVVESAPSTSWDHVDQLSESELLAQWRSLVPEYRGWEVILDDLPHVAAKVLARALLREGNFRCAAAETVGCGAGGRARFHRPADSASIEDPCVRRHLALWAMDQLAPADVPALLPVLLQIAALPPPESELVAAVLELVGKVKDDEVQLRVYLAAHRAGHRELVADVLDELTEAGVFRAARENLDAALIMLDVSLAQDLYLAAVDNHELLPATRIHAIDELAADLASRGEKLPRPLKQALRRIGATESCALAASAIAVLIRNRDASAIPRRRSSDTVADTTRSLCILARLEVAPRVLQTLVGPAGIKTITRARQDLPDADDHDRDGDPMIATSYAVVEPGQLGSFDLFGDQEFARALLRCRGNRCFGDHVYQLGWVRARGAGLVLDSVIRTELGSAPESESEITDCR